MTETSIEKIGVGFYYNESGAVVTSETYKWLRARGYSKSKESLLEFLNNDAISEVEKNNLFTSMA